MPYSGFDYLDDEHPYGKHKCPMCGSDMAPTRSYVDPKGRLIEVVTCTRPLCPMCQDDPRWNNVQLPRGIFKVHRDGRKRIEK